MVSSATRSCATARAIAGPKALVGSRLPKRLSQFLFAHAPPQRKLPVVFSQQGFGLGECSFPGFGGQSSDVFCGRGRKAAHSRLKPEHLPASHQGIAHRCWPAGSMPDFSITWRGLRGRASASRMSSSGVPRRMVSSRDLRVLSWKRLCLRGCGSTTWPPPTVMLGEGGGLYSGPPWCGHRVLEPKLRPPLSPGSRRSLSSRVIRAAVSADPVKKSKKRHSAQQVRGRREARGQEDIAARGGFKPPGVASTMPRLAAALPHPRGSRPRGYPVLCSRPCALGTCRPRIRARNPPGSMATSWPARKVPSMSVPVTTVPKPEMVKTRSTGRRGWPRSRRGCVSSSSTRSPA